MPPDTLLDPSTYLNPIMKSRLVKDLEHLVSINQGKMSNFNRQTVDSLAVDLGIRLPRKWLPTWPSPAHSPRSKPRRSISPALAGTPSPAPVPEPGTVVIFGLATFALAARSWLARHLPKIVGS